MNLNQAEYRRKIWRNINEGENNQKWNQWDIGNHSINHLFSSQTKITNKKPF